MPARIVGASVPSHLLPAMTRLWPLLLLHAIGFVPEAQADHVDVDNSTRPDGLSNNTFIGNNENRPLLLVINEDA
jgi:hypothetical protein